MYNLDDDDDIDDIDDLVFDPIRVRLGGQGEEEK